MLFFLLALAFVSAIEGAPRKDWSPTLVPTLDGRIVGGESTFIEEYPYQASLLYLSSHRCGAVIINENYVLTAAHCTIGIRPSLLSLRVGSTFRNTGGIVLQIEEVYEDPRFNSTLNDYDITVLKLASPLNFGSAVATIPLPAEDYRILPGVVSQVTGWGALSQDGAAASQLQVVEVPLVSIEECKNAYGAENITERMICAGYPQGGKDACQGDSGGPLVADGLLLGLVSWGEGCAQPNYPGVYSNVASLRDFINEITGL